MKTLDVSAHIKAAATLIRSARCLTAFTGTGISVESGIPPFRGPGGLCESATIPACWSFPIFAATPGSAERC